MPRIQCPWVTCRYNTGECDCNNYLNNAEFGECEYEGIVDLHTNMLCEECNTESDMLSCESFASKVWEKETGKRII